MSKEETGKGWRGISEEIIVGMTEWRQQNPGVDKTLVYEF